MSLIPIHELGLSIVEDTAGYWAFFRQGAPVSAPLSLAPQGKREYDGVNHPPNSHVLEKIR